MIEKIEALLTKNKELIDLCDERHKQKLSKTDITFNIFNLVSDKYHRENFHSDIIAALLDRKANHNEQNKFLNEFLKLINRIKNIITLSDFQNAIVTREKGRIDILIRDEISRKAIIVENKIKNAGDTYRQLPKYIEYTVGKDYEVVAIVYIPLDTNKTPNEQDWKKDEREEINKKLVIIPVFDANEKDFLNGWIKCCELVAKNVDALSVIKQYGALINNISINIMDNQIMEKFYKLTCENYKTVIETRNMLNELPKYLATRIKQRYSPTPPPFNKTWIWQNTVAVIDEYYIDSHCITIDIVCSSELYTLTFFDRQYDSTTNVTEDILRTIGLADKMAWNGRRFEKKFAFPDDEDKLFIFIDILINKLQNNVLENSPLSMNAV